MSCTVTTVGNVRTSGIVPEAACSRRAPLRAAEVVPDSVDAFTGIASSSAALGECPAARSAFAQAQRFAAPQHRTVDVIGKGYPRDIRAAIARCNG
jgi:hypothetical protein